MSFSGQKQFCDTAACEEPEFASLSSYNSQKWEAVLVVEKADLPNETIN